MIELKYDKRATAGYITLKKGKWAKTKELIKDNSDILIDYNDKGEILGIEILNLKIIENS